MSIPSRDDWFVDDVDGTLPGHLELPHDHGEFVENGLRFPQNMLLTGVLWPHLERIGLDGQYVIWANAGIYWRLTEPRERGVVVADWMYVSGTARLPEGKFRRSYVLWKEKIAPEIVMNFTLGDGGPEHDWVAPNGRFWIYEHAVRARYYVIFMIRKAELEVYRLEDGFYRKLTPNSSGRYPIASFGLELGVWRGCFLNQTAPWLRWYDSKGEMLLMGNERADLGSRRAQAEHEHAEAVSQLAGAVHYAAFAAKETANAARQVADLAENPRLGSSLSSAILEAATSLSVFAEEACQIAEIQRRVEETALAERRCTSLERERGALYAAKLKALGIDPDSL